MEVSLLSRQMKLKQRSEVRNQGPRTEPGSLGSCRYEIWVCFCLFFVILSDLNTWLEDPSSPNRDGTWAPWLKALDSQPLDHQGIPFLFLSLSFWILFLLCCGATRRFQAGKVPWSNFFILFFIEVHIKSTILKYTIQWHLVYSQYCITIASL